MALHGSSASESSLVAVVGRDSSGVVGRDFLREPGLGTFAREPDEPGRRGVFSAEPGLERLLPLARPRPAAERRVRSCRVVGRLGTPPATVDRSSRTRSY